MIDIYSKGGYPADVLSNFYPNGFEIDGVRCRSMESFLQSLKYKNARRQIEVCLLAGKKAKQNAQAKNWRKKQILWWRGKKYKRADAEYQELLRHAYASLAVNPVFIKALKDTGSELLTHSIGKQNPNETILTEKEFCGLLADLRNK